MGKAVALDQVDDDPSGIDPVGRPGIGRGGQVVQDPQVVQTGMLTWTDYPGLSKPAPLVSGPVEFSGMETGIRRRPPTLGEHTDQVLVSVGYSPSEIAGLRERRIV